MARELLELDPAAIVVGERLRPIDEVWAARLADIIRVESQLTPIQVCEADGGHLLVAGAHRQAACRLLGRLVIAELVEADDLSRRQREVSENYWRKGLSPLEKAAFVAELHQIARVRAGVDPTLSSAAASVRARWNKRDGDTNPNLGFVYGWNERVAEDLGSSRSAVFRSLALHRNLPADLHITLAGHAILRNTVQLQGLAKAEPKAQARLIEQLAAGAGSLAQAKTKLAERDSNQPPRIEKTEFELRRDRAFNAVQQCVNAIDTSSERIAIFEYLAEQFPTEFSNFLQRRAAAERRKGQS